MVRKVKMSHEDIDYLLDRLSEILRDNNYEGNEDEICNSLLKYIEEERHDSMKPFDLEAAKAGKPVYTRDGRKARIICFDKNKDIYPLVVLVCDGEGYEMISQYKADGVHPTIPQNDLMMLSEKKEGWIKVKKDVNLYATKEEADRKMIGNTDYVSAKVEWEE